MINGTTQSPIEDPTIEIGGATYSLRFSLVAELIADELGLDITDFFASLRTRNSGKLTAYMKLFSAMVGHHFIGLHQQPPTHHDWMARIDALGKPASDAKFRELCEAVGKCLSAKIQASAAVKLQETAPAQERAN